MQPNSSSTKSLYSLQEITLFKDLTPPQLGEIYQSGVMCRVSRGDFFFHQSDPATALYVLLEGQVHLTCINAQGKQVIIRLISPGTDFGTLVSIPNKIYSLSAQATEDCLALVWRDDERDYLYKKYPALPISALNLVEQRLHHLQTRYLELATERVEQRLARALLRLTQERHRYNGHNKQQTLTLSRQDLAEFTGTTLYSISRILCEWERQGLVEIGRERVKICHIPNLKAVAEL